MAFNPMTIDRSGDYMYQGLTGLGESLGAGLGMYNMHEDENAMLGSYLKGMGIPEDSISGLSRAERRGLAQAHGWNADQLRKAQQSKLEAMADSIGISNDYSRAMLDRNNASYDNVSKGLQMYGTNLSDYERTPAYLRDPNYDALAEPIKRAYQSGDINAAMVLHGLKPKAEPQMQWSEGPGGAVGWSRGNQAGVVLPKGADGGQGSGFESSMGKIVGDIQRLQAAGQVEQAQQLSNYLAAKSAMEDGIDDRTLMLMQFQNPALYNQVIQARLQRLNAGGSATNNSAPAVAKERQTKASNLLGL